MKFISVELSETQMVWLAEKLSNLNYDQSTLLRRILNFAIENENQLNKYLNGKT